MATVDLSGNIGGISHYGRGAYGRGPYSRDLRLSRRFSSGDFDLVGTAYFFGDLSPSVTFAGAFGFDFLLGGDLAPQVTFADLSVDVSLAGDLSPQVTLEGLLGVDLSLNSIDGSFGFTVVLGRPA